MRIRKKRGERGQAMVETALLAPWIFFLFVGVFDLGFYCYSYICTQNAARAAAIQTAADEFSQSTPVACRAALTELNFMANVVGVTTCGTVVSVVRQTRCGTSVNNVPDCTFGTATNPPPADATQDQKAASSFVSVTYQTIPLIPIPGILVGRFNITRNAEMRIIQE